MNNYDLNSCENMHHGAKSDIFLKAHNLRLAETKTEKLLWEHLRNNALGVKFRRQHPIGIFILDFYCHQLKVAFEIDGNYHDLPDQKKWDQERTEYLNQNGITVIRFRNEEITSNLPNVLERIKLLIRDRKAL